MTDPTPTRAEVDIEALIRSLHHNSNVGKALVSIKAENQALRERAEAAERELARVRQLAWDAQGKADRDAALLTAARRAEAAAWNDAIEAAEQKADQYIAMGWRGAELPEAIRALRRAAPTEGEA